MAARMSFRRLAVFALLPGMLAASAQAQFYGGPGMGLPGSTWAPYGYPYLQGVPGADAYGYGSSIVPPPSRYFTPGFSYNGNPYAPVPNTFSYEIPQNAYAPDTYPYDLRAYGYGYPPPIATTPPAYPYGYYLNYDPDPGLRHRGLPGYNRGVYRELSLPEYFVLQLHGPVRVRAIVPGVPGLGG